MKTSVESMMRRPHELAQFPETPEHAEAKSGSFRAVTTGNGLVASGVGW